MHGLVPGVQVTPHLDDIEALNIRAAGPDAEVTKVSINAYGHGLRDRYMLLRVRRRGRVRRRADHRRDDHSARSADESPFPASARPARAADLTAARPASRPIVMRFDQIEDAVLRGDADCGVLIHEGRFTYEAKGLTLLADLGKSGKSGCIARCRWRRSRFDAIWRRSWRRRSIARFAASVEYAFAHPEASRDYVAAHAQEMDPDVTRAPHPVVCERLHARAGRDGRDQDARVGRAGRRVPAAPITIAADLRLRLQGLKTSSLKACD